MLKCRECKFVESKDFLYTRCHICLNNKMCMYKRYQETLLDVGVLYGNFDTVNYGKAVESIFTTLVKDEEKFDLVKFAEGLAGKGINNLVSECEKNGVDFKYNKLAMYYNLFKNASHPVTIFREQVIGVKYVKNKDLLIYTFNVNVGDDVRFIKNYKVDVLHYTMREAFEMCTKVFSDYDDVVNIKYLKSLSASQCDLPSVYDIVKQ